MTEETVEVRESTPEEIAEAQAQGWKDNPDHPNYKEAWQFVEDGKKIAPMAAERNTRLSAEVTSLKQTIEEMRNDFFKQRLAGEKAGYERAKRELENRKEKAYEDGDVDELKRIDREEKALKPPEEKEPPPAQEVNVDFIEWKEKNSSWFGDTSDREHLEMTLYAESIGKLVASEFPEGTPLSKVYAAIEKKVRERFPEKFNGGNKVNAAAVEGGDNRPTKRTGKQDWKSLPKEIREEADRTGYVKRYFQGDKEAYAKHYYQVFGQEA